MANTTAPAKPAADVKDEAAAPVETAATDAIDPKELTQAIRLLRFKIGQLQADARRATPYLSRTTEEATAKYRAAIKTVVEMSTFIDQQKTV